MPLPTPADVHVNTPLTNISIAYMQSAADFIADRVFPAVPVLKQSDRYYTYDRGYWNRDDMQERAPASESAGTGYTVDNSPNYFCIEKGLHQDVPWQVRGNADPVVNPDRDATMLVTQKALIHREVKWVAGFFAGGLWTGDDDGVAASVGTNEFLQWNDAASTPIEDIRAAGTSVQQLTGFRPNKLTVGREVYDKLVDHPDIVDRIKYTSGNNNPAVVNKEALAALFELDEVLVAGAIQNTANENATNVHAFIGGKKALLTYSPPNPSLMTPSAGYTFNWTGLSGVPSLAQRGARVSVIPMPLKKADRVEIEDAFDQKLISADLGYFFDTAVA